MKWLVYLAAVAAMLCTSCQSEEKASGPEPYTATGEASFYGRFFQGKTTADGGTFNKDSLTAAHLYLPFGTVVRVDNLDTNKSVNVTITDRGPYSGERIIDLSRAAADSLGMVEDGTARVRLTVITAAEGYTVADSVAENRTDELSEK